MFAKLWKALFGAWETFKDDGVFQHQRNSKTGDERYTVPAWRIRALKPQHRPEGYVEQT